MALTEWNRIQMGDVRGFVAAIAEEITDHWPVAFLWGKNNGTSGEHPRGLALDFSILAYGDGPDDPGPADHAKGEQIANYLWENRERLSVWYVVWNRRIISTNPDGYAHGKWTTYRGDNPHTDHVHVSFKNTGTYTPPAGGGHGGNLPANAVSLSNVRHAARTDPPAAQGHKGEGWRSVYTVELALHGEGLLSRKWVDGSFGTKTIAAYAVWQRRCGYTGSDADGIPGIKSLQRLGARHGFKVTT